MYTGRNNLFHFHNLGQKKKTSSTLGITDLRGYKKWFYTWLVSKMTVHQNCNDFYKESATNPSREMFNDLYKINTGTF